MLAHGEIKSALGISARHPRTFQSGVQSEICPGFPLKACGNDGAETTSVTYSICF